jgi:hypothetical protein
MELVDKGGKVQGLGSGLKIDLLDSYYAIITLFIDISLIDHCSID